MSRFYKYIFLASFFLTFSSLSVHAATWFWVNGSGNFNDASHWSNISGGRSNGLVPGSYDDVIIDENSFGAQGYIVLDRDIQLRDFILRTDEKVKISSLNGSALSLSGSFSLLSKVDFDVPLLFNGNKLQEITTNGNELTQKVTVQTSGKVSMKDDLIMGRQKLTFEKGAFISNSFNIVADELVVANAKKTDIHLGTSLLLLNNPVLAESIKGDYKPVANSNNGNYQLRGTSTCGTIPFTITTIVTSNYNGQNVSCNGASDATICVNVVGGVGPFTFQWISGPATQCWSGVDAGTYIIVVFDVGQGNTPCNTTVQVTEPPEMTLFSWTGSNPSCNGVCDGTATPIIIGGTPGYTYLWSSGETTATASQLCVGQNLVTVTDANGCIFDTTFFILTPTPVDPGLSATDVDCFGACNGYITSTPTGGNGAPYSWNWSTGSTLDSIGGLCPNNYSVIVTDNNGCTGSANVNITEPIAIAITLTNTTNLVCNGICTGSLTVSSTNGTAPHSYQWYDAATNLPLVGQTNPTATNLCAGDYYVIVTDAQGCDRQSVDFTVTEPTAITANATATNATCNGICDGVLTVNPSGGTPNYTITWFDAANPLNPIGVGSPLGGQCDGNYFAEIQDDNGCIINTNVVTITEPTALTISVTDTDILCANQCTGTAAAVVSGGTGTLTVTWHFSPSGVQTGSPGLNISNLCDGNYFATVTDDNGCNFDSPVFAITEPLPLVIVTQSNTDVTCNGSCNGTVTMTVTGGTGSISIEWFDGSNTLVGNGSPLGSLCPDTYTGIATDDNGCTITSQPQTITEPLPLSITADTTGTQCGTACTGTATTTVSGGTLNYSFQWIDATTGTPIGQTTNPATGLCAGMYYVEVTDANGCLITSPTVTILPNTVVTGNINSTDVTCNSLCNGLADLSVSGGVLPMTYVWYDNTGNPIGQSTEDANGLCAGSYFVIATDANLCSSVPINVTITEPNAITITNTSTNITCNGSCDGEITATVTGGTAPLTYSWLNSITGFPIGQTGLTATGLCAGTYEIQVTDANGCITNGAQVTITEPTAISGTLSTTNITCNGGCNGQASYTVAGGTGTFTFTWSSSANTTSLETGLCAGSYTVSVSDGSGCALAPVNFTITEPVGLTATTTNGSISCGGLNDGSVSVTAVGGTPPLSYLWSNSGTTPVISGLAPGTYTVNITDANGCTYGPFSATVSNLSTVTVSATSTDASCNGICDGTGTAVGAGGAGGYTYTWSDPFGQTSATALGLCAGNYTVTATDANGCTSSAASITVNEPTAVSANVSSTSANCNGTCDGTATVAGGGGTSPYTFAWSTGETTTTISNLCAGSYDVTVTDFNGCTATSSINISEPSTLTATSTTTTTPCSVCNGSATVNPSGGTGGYTYQWGASAANQVTQTATGLCAGVHNVIVTDGTGCTFSLNVGVSNQTGEVLSMDSTAASCDEVCNGTATVSFVCNTPPCTQVWDDGQITNTATGLCAGIYNVTVTNGSGCITVGTVEVTAPNGVSANATSTDALCNGTCTGTGTATPTGGTSPYTYLWNDGSAQTTSTAFNLCPGNFEVIVTDSVGCKDTATVIIAQPTALTFVTTTNNASCNLTCNGVGIAFPAGGTSPYTYAWDDPSTQTSQSATGLCAGTYNVTVFDDNGCTSGPQTVTINEPTSPTISVISTNPSCSNLTNGTATATVTGGTAPYTYQWDDPLNQTTATATNLGSGTFTVTVTDANGCVLGAQSVTLTSPSALTGTLTSTNPLCFGDCNGQIDASVSGGTAPYNYSWNPGAQTTATAINLCSGNYTLTVSDNNGCTANLTATLTDPVAISSNVSLTDATCSGMCDGTASVTPSGGTGTLNILWLPDAQSTTSISGLCAGNYSVIVSDANGCSQTTPFAIDQPATLSLVTGSSPSACGACDGTASVSPTGGTPGFSYQWDAAAGSQSTKIAGNLCAGVYSVTVTDINGCSSNAVVSVTDNNAESLTVNINDASCPDACNGSVTTVSSCVNGPCSFAWFNGTTGANMGISTTSASNLCPGNYFVELTNGIGCTSITPFTIGSPDTLDIQATVSTPICAGLCNATIALVVTGGNGSYNYDWDAAAGNATTASVSNLCIGSYTVIVADGAGCDDTVTYTVVSPTQIVVNVSNTDVTCNGDCDGSGTALVTGGTPPYSYSWNSTPVQTSPVATNLCSGNYSLLVTDAAGCTQTAANISITQPQPLVMNPIITNVVCPNACDGTADANTSGGVTPYTFIWNNQQTTETATNLCPGTYDVTVTDASGCQTGPQSVNITEPTPLDFTFTTTDATCSGSCIGSITITASGGTGAYQYSINNGSTFQASNVFNNLCAGSYDVVVIDASSCLSPAQNVNINEPTAITSTSSVFAPACGQNNGAVSIFPSGGTPVYTFDWMDATLTSIGQTTQTAINLAAGIYIVNVTDAAGCTEQFTVPLNNNNAPNVNSVTTTPVCNGECTGTIDVTTTGGQSPYLFLWFPNGESTEDLTAQCAGTYLLEVTDALNCIAYHQATIAEPAPFVANFNVSSASCGQCNGSAVVNASGGTGNSTVLWSDGQTTTTASNLCAGAYTVLVSDSAGCSQQFNVSVDNTGAPFLTVSVTNASCANVCSGTASLSGSGGTAPYSFLWLHDQSTATSQNNLCAGTYFVQVTDSLGCTNTNSFNITAPSAITDSMVVLPANCGVCDGQLTAFVSGFSPFTYQWDAAAGSATTQSVSNLCAGTYTVIVTDNIGCSDTLTGLLLNTNTPQMSVSTTDIDCNGNCNGTADVVITTGTAPYITNWLDDLGSPTGQTGTSATGLCEGDYIVQVTDASGCMNLLPLTITAPDPIQLSFPFTSNETCFDACDGIIAAMPINGTLPITYQWNDPNAQTTSIATGLCDSAYTVNITDANGCTATLTDTIFDPPAITIQLDSVDASCTTVNDGSIDATVTGGAGGFTFVWTGPNNFTDTTEDISNLFNGTYILTATDANGCSVTDSIVVNALIVAVANAGPDTTMCINLVNMDITGSGSAGATYQWLDTLGNVIDNDSILTITNTGGTTSYILTIDVSGCVASDTVTITFNTLPLADAGQQQEIILGQSVTIGGSPTTNPGNTVVWTPSTFLNSTTIENPTSTTPDTTTTYFLTVTDPNGCINTDSVTVIVYPDIVFPNGFSPNGDGANDEWIIDFIDQFPDCEVEVYNRWGQPLFYSRGYNDPWDGTYNGKGVTVGTYYYIIKLNHELYPEAFTGPLTILR